MPTFIKLSSPSFGSRLMILARNCSSKKERKTELRSLRGTVSAAKQAAAEGFDFVLSLQLMP